MHRIHPIAFREAKRPRETLLDLFRFYDRIAVDDRHVVGR